MRIMRLLPLPALVFVSGLAGAEEKVLEEIVVTAQKRAESLQDVPISMEVKSAEELNQYQIRDLNALQAYVPNLLIQASPGSHAIYVRGFGSQAANYAAEQSVSMYMDGVYGGKARQFMAPFFDVERIEVLRGPQGALLGKNTAAGAISIVSASPTDEFEGGLTASYNFDRDGYESYGYVSGPLGERVSGRLAFKVTALDGYIDNRSSAPGSDDAPELDNQMVRGSLKFEPLDNLEIIAKLEYADFETRGYPTVRVDPFVKAVLDDSKTAGPAIDMQEEDTQDGINLSITTNIGLGEHVLTLVTGYSDYDNEKATGGGANDPENWLTTFDESFDQFSQEIRLLSPQTGNFEYVVGLYYDRADWSHDNGSRYVDFLGLPFFDGAIHQEFEQDSETISAFAVGTWHFTDVFRMSASVRYTENEKDGDFELFADAGIPIGAPIAIKDSIDEDNFDPSLSFQYDLSPNVMVYAAYSEGSKSGGFVAARTVTPGSYIFKEEKAKNYEVGIKSTLLDNRLFFNATYYHVEFEDLQVSTYDSSIPGFVSGNAGEATSKGFEASFAWQIINNLRFGISAAYLDAEYDDFPGAQCPTAIQGTPACDAATNTTNLGGTTILGASDWTGNVELRYEQPIADNLLLTALVSGYYRSEFTTSTDQDAVYGVQDGYDKWDARISVGSQSGSWEVALIGRNITNELTQDFSYLWPLQPPPVGIQFLGETKTYALEASVRF